jgi:predicted ATPase
MSHPFGDLLTQHLHRKHGLSQAKLAAGILQTPSIISEMCQGKRLRGQQARERVTAIITWLQQQGTLTTLDEANALLRAAGMSPFQERDPAEASLIRKLSTQASAKQRPVADAPPTPVRLPHPMPRHNLPAQLTPFIGRSEQIAQLAQHLQNHRLVTLTGAGGVGKIRLAIEVATRVLAHFADGVWFTDLTPLTDPQAIPQRILDLWRVPEQPERSPLEALTVYLRTKEALLILDNCEHLIDACAALTETLLQQCPQLSLLATSREALNIGGETPWRVPSLTRPHAGSGWEGQSALAQTPFTLDALLRFEAVALFVERANVRQPGFALTPANAPAVAHICSRLDGVPLALEMAAARINIFTVEELARRLDGAFDGRFQLLTSGVRTAPLRHQTLRATLEWSYSLLTAKEQWLLACLSVFSGGWTFAAAQEVTGCSLDRLAQLVNKSLVIADQQAGQTRYRLLETVRQFAAEKGALDEQTYRQAQAQYSHYYLTLLAAQERRIQGPQQRTALDTLRADFEHIKVAWRWAVEQYEFALLDPAVHPLFLYCEVRGHFREGVRLFDAAAAELTAAIAASATNRSELQTLLGRVLTRVGALKVMGARFESAINPLEQALGYVTTDWERAFTLAYLGWVAMGRGNSLTGRALVHQSLVLSRHCEDSGLIAVGLFYLANNASTYTEKVRGCEESLVLWRQVGRPDRIADVLGMLAWHTCCLGDYAQAIAYWKESIELCTALGMQSVLAWVIDGQGWVAWCQGDLSTAQSYLQEAAELYHAIGISSSVGRCLAVLALVLRSGGDVERAVAVARQAVAIERDTDDPQMLVLSLNYLGAALIGAGNFAAARQALKEAFQQLLVAQYPFFTVIAFYYFAELVVLESRAANLPLTLERKSLAVALLSCVRTQTVTWQIYKEKAAQLQAEIEEALPADLRATAITRGQSCSLEEMAAIVLAVLDKG